MGKTVSTPEAAIKLDAQEKNNMGIIIWIVFGALVGWAASALMGTSSGLVWDILVGIIGAVIGGFVMNMLGEGGVVGFTLYSFLVALLGACILIWLMRLFRRQGRA